MKKRRVLIVPDSFKGSLSAKEVVDTIAAEFPEDKFDVTAFPVSDGGDGALDVLKNSLRLNEKRITVHNAYGITKDTEYLYDSSGVAYITVSESSGIQGFDNAVLNPLIASTYGTGEVIDHALESDISTINLFLGGSATVDGGTGMLAALGSSFFNGVMKIDSCKTNPLVNYNKVKIDKAIGRLKNININLITDVDNPATGEYGAARVYGPQKGAGKEDIKTIESKMVLWVKLLEEISVKNLNHIPGMGAAGGIGLPLMAFSNTNIYKGASWFISKLNIVELVARADVVITGEGSIDNQTLMGKIPGEIAKLAGNKNKIVIGVCGKSSGNITGFDMLYSLKDIFDVSEKYAITNAKKLLANMAGSIASNI
jgi:glycerate kinase